MVCDPNSNNINPPVTGPPAFVPGWGFPQLDFQLPFPDELLPEGIPEDLLELLERIFALFPGGEFIPNFDFNSKEIVDALASVLNQIAPYLVLYKFFQALLNIILCIIDVLCSAIWSMPGKIRRLFKRCLPDFLNLFPWLALLAMIIALLLLLLALIEYLIQRIIDFINRIIANLRVFADAVQIGASEPQILAAVEKLSFLLCLIEQLFAILIAFQAILSVIEALARLGGRGVCGKGGGSSGISGSLDDPDCCPEELCPPFIADQPDGFISNTGRLVYHKEINNDVSGFGFFVQLGAVRNQRWQFYDTNFVTPFQIKDIITPINKTTFFPEGKSYTKDSNVRRIPYNLEMSLYMDPTSFDHPDTGGWRQFFIEDLVTLVRPYIGVVGHDNTTSTTAQDSTGTILIEGGLVFEADKTTPYIVDGQQATLNTFITQDPIDIGVALGDIPDDGYTISGIEYTYSMNHNQLMSDLVISAGCIPDLATESLILNATLDIRPVIDQMGALPNIGSLSGGRGTKGSGGNTNSGTGTLGCLETALEDFRSDVSIEGAEQFQATAVACLNGLRDETLTAYNNAVNAATNQYESTVTLDPDLQFIGETIEVTVTLKDIGGNTISNNVPDDSSEDFASRVVGDVTLGNISSFTYDGYESFTANIDSDQAGLGILTVAYDGNIFSDILNREDDDIPTEISERVLNYEFVSGVVTKVADDDGAIRRDESDAAGAE